MTTPARLLLLAAAILCGGYVALLGDSLSAALEPQRHTSAATLFWVAAGAVIAAPMWVPAMIPARFARLAKICRWLGALTLLVPALLFGSIVTHNLGRAIAGTGATPSALFAGLALSAACLAALATLLWPELRMRKRT